MAVRPLKLSLDELRSTYLSSLRTIYANDANHLAVEPGEKTPYVQACSHIALRIVVTHLEFSLYWPARLHALQAALRARGDELHAIDVSTKGSPYEFSTMSEATQNGTLSRTTLFINTDIKELAPALVQHKLTKVLDSLQPDVVITCPIAFTPGATSVRWCRQNRRGVVVMDDARLEDVPRSRLVNLIKSRVYANVDAMFVPAQSHLKTCEFFGFQPERVFYGVDVIDNDWFNSRGAQARNSECRSVRGIQLPAKFFLGVGRQVPKKNWAQLLTAYNDYQRGVTEPWELVLVGNGENRAELEKQVQANAISGVHFIPYLTADELAEVYAAASCLVLPSVYGETWGLVVNEAMACGLPILVSSECGCALTLVENDHNGWTFSPHDAAELTAAMTRMASQSPDDADLMRSSSRRIIKRWGLERFVEGACAAIDSCRSVRRGFANPLDRLLMRLWKGRYRPT